MTTINIYKNSELVFSAESETQAFEFVQSQEDFSWEGVKESNLKSVTWRDLQKNKKTEWARLGAPYIADELDCVYLNYTIKDSQKQEIRSQLEKGMKGNVKLTDWRSAKAEKLDFMRNPKMWMIKNNITIETDVEESAELVEKFNIAVSGAKEMISIEESKVETQIELNKIQYDSKVSEMVTNIMRNKIKEVDPGTKTILDLREERLAQRIAFNEKSTKDLNDWSSLGLAV